MRNSTENQQMGIYQVKKHLYIEGKKQETIYRMGKDFSQLFLGKPIFNPLSGDLWWSFVQTAWKTADYS